MRLVLCNLFWENYYSLLMSLLHDLDIKHFLILVLRKAFKLFEGHMTKVVQEMAQRHVPWETCWFDELQSSVADRARKYVVLGQPWDTYALSQMISKNLDFVFLGQSPHAVNDASSEILRNAVNHVGFTRYLLSHNQEPSCSEIASCLAMLVVVAEAFPLLPQVDYERISNN